MWPKSCGQSKPTLRDRGGVMLLWLSPIPARPLGHAVHRAPDTECDQHPGYGAAGHAVWNAPLVTGGPCAQFISPGTEESSVPVQLSRAALQPSPISPPLCSLRPQCVGYQAVGVIYRGMAYCQAEEGGPKKGTDYPRSALEKWGKQTFCETKMVTHM